MRRFIESVEWLRDGRGFLVTAEEESAGITAHHQVLEVSYPEARVTRVTNDLGDHHMLTASADLSSLVVIDLVGTSSIWVAPPGQPGQAARVPGGRTQGFRGVGWTGDGRLVFGDEASTGWVMNADGSALRPFSAHRRPVSAPRLCGKGPLLTFLTTLANSAGDLEIWAGDPDGGVARKVAESRSLPAKAPWSCSPDGQTLYFSKRPSGIWKQQIHASASEGASVMFEDTHQGSVSPDGKWMALHTGGAGKPHRFAIRSMTGGPDAVFPAEPVINEFVWTHDSSGLIYVKNNDTSNLWTRPLGGGPEKQITHFTSDRVMGFAISPDGRLAIARGDQARDAVLIQRQ